jgi:hypothetical protein
MRIQRVRISAFKGLDVESKCKYGTSGASYFTVGR